MARPNRAKPSCGEIGVLSKGQRRRRRKSKKCSPVRPGFPASEVSSSSSCSASLRVLPPSQTEDSEPDIVSERVSVLRIVPPSQTQDSEPDSVSEGVSVLRIVPPSQTEEAHPDCADKRSVGTSSVASACEGVRTSKQPEPGVLLMPGPGRRLDCMLSLIHQNDAQLEHLPSFTRLTFPAMKTGPRMLKHLKMRRLRDLIAYSHHLDEKDRFLASPVAMPDPMRSFPANDKKETLSPSTLLWSRS